ncbi:MAG: DUF5696 domain-containing protein, partial [bacterium]|nr:DUF5696 domain-containing protein [bacterium]
VLRCRLDLAGADTGKIIQVVFPPSPVLEDPEARLVVPQWLGLLVAPGGDDMRVRRSVWLRPWCMRFIGATQPVGKAGQSYIAIAADSLYRGVGIWRAGGRLGFEYVGDRSWPEQTAAERSQSLDFEFLDGNYVAIARCYRQWMETQPRWRTFATRARPPRPELIGGAQFFAHVPCDYSGATLSFDDLAARIEGLRKAGVERAIFHLGGWNKDGYDSHYPDVLPANPRCGGNDGMRRLTDAIDRAGYLCTPHDDLSFISEETPLFDPRWVARLPSGDPVVRTDIYRRQVMCMTSGAAQAHFARRNAPEVHRLFPNLHGYLYDVSTSTPPLEDYSTQPPVLKADDLAGRLEAFMATREAFAEFIVGESIVDWAIGVYDAGFMAEEGYHHRGDGGWIKDELHGVIVPLWDLVYHDSVIAVREAPNQNKVNTDLETADPFVRYLRLFLKTLRAGTLPPCIYSDDLTMNIMARIKADG